MLSVKMACGLTESIFRLEVVGDVNMPQAGLYDKKLLLVENRNYVWSDLSRLVDVECKNGLWFNSEAFFSGQKLLVM